MSGSKKKPGKGMSYMNKQKKKIDYTEKENKDKSFIFKLIENMNTAYGTFMILFIWYIFYYLISSPVIPAPHKVLLNFIRLFPDVILIHLIRSLIRITAAVSISLLLGVSIGLALGMNEKFDEILSPVIYILYPIPKIAFLPVLMILMGLGDLPKVVLITLIIIFQIIVTTRDAVKGLGKELFYSVRSLGMNKKQIYRHLIIPAVLPKILTSLRISVGTSIAVLFFAENFATTYGIGYFIMNSWSTVNYTAMFSGILALSLLGLALFKIIDIADSKLCSWVKLS
ncbi:MAG: ABC transporter permease [Bacillota bacterium]